MLRAELARLAHLQAAQLARLEVPSFRQQPAAEQSELLGGVPEEQVVQQLRAAQALAALAPCIPVRADAAAEPQVSEAMAGQPEVPLASQQPAV